MYTRDDLISAAQDLYKKYGRLTQDIFLKELHIGKHTIKKFFDSFSDLLRQARLPQNLKRGITKADVIAAMREFYAENGYITATKFRRQVYSQVVLDRLGGYTTLALEAGVPIACGTGLSNDDLIAELKRLYDTFGYVSYALIDQHSQFRPSIFRQRFGNLKNAYREAGVVGGVHSKLQSQGEQILHRILSTLLHATIITQYSPHWLTNPEGERRLFVDFYIPKYNIAIEYNGRQHYHYIEFFHNAPYEFERRQLLDLHKAKLLAEHNIPLIIISHTEPLTLEYIGSILDHYIKPKVSPESGAHHSPNTLG